MVSRGTEENTPLTTNRADEGGRDLRGPTEVRSKSAGAGGQDKQMDLVGNMETHRRESLCALGSSERLDNHKEAGSRHQGKFDDG